MNDDIASLGGLDATFDLPDGRRVRLGDMTVADMRSMAVIARNDRWLGRVSSSVLRHDVRTQAATAQARLRRIQADIASVIEGLV